MNTGLSGTGSGGSDDAETHRELSELVVVLIINGQTKKSNYGEVKIKEKANLVTGTLNTDRTQETYTEQMLDCSVCSQDNLARRKEGDPGVKYTGER